MPVSRCRFALGALVALAAAASSVAAQNAGPFAGMRWRQIGPTRAGRARALSGVASQPNVFYIGFDNGGVWRSTDYGSTWQPLFDDEATGSIGAIAVAPSDPNIIYVGSGAGIIRPDLATGDGMYKSMDAGRSWTHLGLRETQMIANVAVDPTNPSRLFVAALGHPYGPNSERGIFRSTDGGNTFQRVLYKDEYTSGNDVVIDPHDPNIIYAALWQQQQSFRESSAFGDSGNGIFKSTDGGTTWTHLTEGLPPIIEANLAIAPSDSRIVYAMSAVTPKTGPAAGNTTTGVVALYRSDDAGAHWTAVDDPTAVNSARKPDARPLARIGGGDLPTVAVDPKNPNVVYSAAVVMWRSDDGGHTWTAVRGAPGGDDYQKIWINPKNPDIILVVSDQGGVVSANRGVSWSNWYTQPTGAMYHVTTDNAFPYRVCGGQQDSGSACVDSRSMDGEITFHDWHPVNIQEYGMAAPDPRNPDMVFGGMRNDVSIYNRKTAQTTHIGPELGAPNTPYNRNVRTMPLIWSPVNNDLLFYASDAVWKTLDRGHTWTRISGDLSRTTWQVPANAGKYASTVTPAQQGVITALSPSPRDINVIWTGTDDGSIHVTTDGGAHWRDVTPAQIKPWTRIFNMDAGHFDPLTAYAAANTLRLDDMSPHFWRTHDGGKTWTEINTGIANGAVANTIREDPKKKGVLYAGTETQVWVSFDDGDHWQSLRLNMPAISVRDLQVKDDSTCLCSDLIAGTHGRGFLVLDDVTPLRQAADAANAKTAYLFKPATAVRVRFATNDPTPWPPELPAGENPPPGGIIDYYLPRDASGPVTLDILDARGKAIRSYSSEDPVLKPDPGEDPHAYNEVCENEPESPDCDVPLYWAAPQMVVSTNAGAHRFSWDLKLEPVTGEEPRAEGPAQGAVPHRDYPQANSPWAPPGNYTVRLTVGGQQYTQPLSLKLDPRVKTTPAGLAQLASLSRELYDDAVAANTTLGQARTVITALDTVKTPELRSIKSQMDSIAPAPTAAPRRRGGPGAAAPAGPPTLASARDALIAAYMAMQGADVAPTARQVASAATARSTFNSVMLRWKALQSSQRRMNAKR